MSTVHTYLIVLMCTTVYDVTCTVYTYFAISRKQNHELITLNGGYNNFDGLASPKKPNTISLINNSITAEYFFQWNIFLIRFDNVHIKMAAVVITGTARDGM